MLAGWSVSGKFTGNNPRFSFSWICGLQIIWSNTWTLLCGDAFSSVCSTLRLRHAPLTSVLGQRADPVADLDPITGLRAPWPSAPTGPKSVQHWKGEYLNRWCILSCFKVFSHRHLEETFKTARTYIERCVLLQEICWSSLQSISPHILHPADFAQHSDSFASNPGKCYK